MSSSGRSSHARLRDAISTDRARIQRGERPTYHVAWAIAVDGSIDVTVRELPLIHQLVPDETSVFDGARFLIARTLEVGPDLFDVTGGSGLARRAPRRSACT